MALNYNNLNAYDAQLASREREFVQALGAAFVGHARDNSPVKTGNLRERNQFEMQGEVGVAYNDASYGVPVNFGHSTSSGTHVPANPFFSLAVDQTVEDAPRIVGEVFG